ncbi:TetR/AcrR family transcriptional regulator [Actinoplanes missouriensis]|uniref:TetR/AcrR family transcriptional regulator n=1 Tax=Actinoplanes missouriensis TaxID=1866 RepID=UPI0033EFFF13
MTGGARQRSTAGERQAQVMEAAVIAFAAKGYYGTTTTEVAQVAGISQGYLYRLYPDKEALFIATIDHLSQRLKAHTASVAARVATTDPALILAELGASYQDLIADRHLLKLLMHGNCAAGEPAIGEAVRRCYAQQVEHVRSVSGASDEQLRRYFADGLLANVVAAVDADTVDAPWARVLRG